jgi:hypothetical protein
MPICYFLSEKTAINSSRQFMAFIAVMEVEPALRIV